MEADVADLTTLPRLLQRNARELGNRPAIREKDRGIWQTWTWRQYHDEVRDLALGLAALGFRRGCRGRDGTDRGERRGGHAEPAETPPRKIGAGENGFVQ